MLFEKFETRDELLAHKLGSALTMERDVLKMLDKLHEEAHSEQLKQHLAHHADETREQERNIVRAFESLGMEADDKPCPAIEAIDKEGRVQIKRAADWLVDDIILAGAAETEHYEIAVYEWLIAHVEAMGRTDVVALLQQNLEQEQHTLDEVRRAISTAAQTTMAAAP